MAYGDFKDLSRRVINDKVLRVKHLIMDINVEMLQWFINFLIKILLVEQLKVKLYLIKNYQKNYTKLLVENLRRRKVHPPFIGNILGVDLADTQLISKFNKGFRLLSRVIDIYGKYAQVIPLKDKK